MDDSSREVEILFGETERFALAQPEPDAQRTCVPSVLKATTPFAAPSRRAAPADTSTPFLPFASDW